MSTEKKKKKSWMIPTRIFCLLLAVVIWVMVVNITSDSFEDTFEIDIRVEGNETLSEKGISIYDRSESKVSVTVRGLRDKIRALKSSDFRAYIDVSSLQTAGKHAVDVKLSVPEDVAVIASSPATVDISIDEIKTVSKSLEVEFKNYSKERSAEINSYRTTPDIITVSGPGSILDRIHKAKAVANLGGITLSDSFENIPENIVLLDEKGNVIVQDYLTFSSDQVHIAVVIDQIRSIPLVYDYAEGFDASRIASVELSMTFAEVKGEGYRFDSLKKFNILTIGPETPAESDVSLSGLRLPEGLRFADSQILDKTVRVRIHYKPEDTTQAPEVTTAPVESSANEPAA